MKASKGITILCSALLCLLAACKGNQQSSPAPVVVTTPNPVPAPTPSRTPHTAAIHNDHKSEHVGNWTRAADGDEITWKLAGDSPQHSYYVCFEDHKKVCKDQPSEFQVTSKPTKCTIDGNSLPAYYDVAHQRDQCGKGHERHRGEVKLFTHCDGCIILQPGP